MKDKKIWPYIIYGVLGVIVGLILANIIPMF